MLAKIINRGVNINTRDNDESLGDMHMKDHMDVSNQENVVPVYFQSLRSSLHFYLHLHT